MVRIKTIKVKGMIDVHPDGDIYVLDPNSKKCHYAGSITDKDLDDTGIIVSAGGKFIRDFIKALKRIEVN